MCGASNLALACPYHAGLLSSSGRILPSAVKDASSSGFLSWFNLKMALLPWLLKMHIDFPSLRVFTFYIIHKRAHTHTHTHTPKHGYCGYPTNNYFSGGQYTGYILLDSYGFIAQLGPCPLVIDQINQGSPSQCPGSQGSGLWRSCVEKLYIAVQHVK